ncbi:MAG: hypothetical protein WA021_02340 [Minisyncoccia bacterium]
MKCIALAAALAFVAATAAFAQQGNEPPPIDGEFWKYRAHCSYEGNLFSPGSAVLMPVSPTDLERRECVLDTADFPDPRDGKFGKLSMYGARWVKQ